MQESIDSTTSDTRFGLKLLGGFRITRDDAELQLSSRKAQLVLAYLAVASRKQARRETLATLCWENAEPEQARNSLRQTLSRLRRALRDDRELIWANGDSVGLHQDAWTIDVDRLLGDEVLDELEAAEPLHEEFLQGLMFREASIDQWLDNQRQRIQELALSKLMSRIDHAMQERRYGAAVQCCLQALARDPFRESVHRMLIRSYQLKGDSARAIRHYKSLRRKLDEELQVPPEAATVELVEQIGRARRIGGARADSPPATPRHADISDTPIAAVSATANHSPATVSGEHAASREDWDDDVDPETITGRDDELALLDRWIFEDRCKLIALLGLGGIGKSSCAMKFARTRQDSFDVVCWKSLRNAPPLDTLLSQLIPLLSNHVDTSKTLARFRHWCQTSRCLVVLDNVESILQPLSNSGDYLPGYEGYGELFRIAGSANHDSCVLLTSREKPVEVGTQEGDELGVRSMQLAGALDIARALQHAKGLHASDEQLQSLFVRYSGNSLALKIVMTTIQDLYDGDVDAFLADEVTVYSNVKRLLTQQFARLSALDRAVMLWLAINRDWTSRKQLISDIYPATTAPQLLASLGSLQRRSLIEVSDRRYRLQSVVLDYVVDHLVNGVVDEITDLKPDHVATHALVRTRSPEHVQSSQRRLILDPVVERLRRQLDQATDRSARMASLLDLVRDDETWRNGYAGGNLVNLLVAANDGKVPFDFSALTLRDVDLRNRRFRDADFSGAHFVDPSITQAFGGVQTIAFSPDGRWMASSHSSLDVYVWNADNLQPVLRLPHSDWARAVRFSRDSQWLATGTDDSTLQLWSLPSGRLERRLSVSGGRIADVEFSADGHTLYTASEDGGLRRWDCRNGDYLSKLSGHENPLWFMVGSSDGRLLASGGEGRFIRIWNTRSGRCLHELGGHPARVSAACFSPDGTRLATAGHDSIVRLWSTESGKCQTELRGHKHWILSLSYSRDGRFLATGSDDRQIRIWHVPPGKAGATECIRVVDGHSNRVGALAFAPNADVLASGSEDQSIRLWDMTPQRVSDDDCRVTANCLRRLQGHTSQIWSVKVSPDEKDVISCGDDPALRLWNLEDGSCGELLEGHAQRVKSISFSSDNETIASASEDQSTRLWKRTSRRCVAVLRGHDQQVWDVCFSPDGRYLATGSEDHSIRIWEVDSGECLKVLEGHDNWVWDVTFSPDGKLLASSSFDCTVRLWHWRSGRCTRTLEGHQGAVMESSFNHDGSMLASTSLYDQTVRLWDTRSGELLESLPDQQSASIEFAPAAGVTDSHEILAIGTRNGLLRLWDIRTHSLWKELAGHNPQYWISSLSFAPSGRFIMTGSGDQTIRQWDLQTGSCTRILMPTRPYQDMIVTDATGLTHAQLADLTELGAVR